MRTKTRLGFGVLATTVLLLGAVIQIGQGAIPRVSPPPQDAANIGLTPAEVESLPAKGSPAPLTPTAQQLAARDAERAAHTELKGQLLRPVKDTDGSTVWVAGTVTVLQEILSDATGDSHKVGRIAFPEPNSIRITLGFFNSQGLRRDLVEVSRLVMDRLPDVENIEFWVYGKNQDSLAPTGEEGIVRTSRSQAVSIPRGVASDTEIRAVLEANFDLKEIGEWALR